MKTRFTTLDICAVLSEINSGLVGMRLANVYDINNKTYLFKLAKTDAKAMLLLESGIRLHISEFDWPKNMMPSGFSMKLRKHLKGRRLVYAKQLGIDRIIDMQFGSDEAAYHLILELYDRGNIILTDHTYTILNLLRYRKERQTGDKMKVGDDSEVRFAVHELYPIDSAKKRLSFSQMEMKLREVLKNVKKGDTLKKILNPHLPFGAPCIEHCLLSVGFAANVSVGKGFELSDNDIDKVISALKIGEDILDSLCQDNVKGYIIQKHDKKADGDMVVTNIEFHPCLFKQFEESQHAELGSFNKAVDDFFGNLESQKADMKIVQLEKSAQKRLDNIKKDHEHRLATLEKQQDSDIYKAKLIEENLPLVEQAIRVVRTAIANQIDWDEITSLIKDAQAGHDPVALAISSLNLQSNEFTMVLTEQAEDCSDSSSDEDDKTKSAKSLKKVKVNIDLGLSAYGNAKKYYSKRKQASHKQQKIVESSEKAYKSAEKKMKQTFDEANKIHNIQKARKTFWFEKFIWFVSSENYLVIGGRDAQQNEIIVKKYLTENDIYVHADLHGATSCIIKNHTKTEIPPKTLNEAGTMAICHSAAWDAKVVTSAWWVYSHQVSKTAPSGEYLTTGSFLIRGKKNYLPPSNLIYGFGILFNVDETCVHKHQDERKVISIDVSQIGDVECVATESLSSELETELQIESDESDDEKNDEEIAKKKQSLEITECLEKATIDNSDLSSDNVQNPISEYTSGNDDSTEGDTKQGHEITEEVFTQDSGIEAINMKLHNDMSNSEVQNLASVSTDDVHGLGLITEDDCCGLSIMTNNKDQNAFIVNETELQQDVHSSPNLQNGVVSKHSEPKQNQPSTEDTALDSSKVPQNSGEYHKEIPHLLNFPETNVKIAFDSLRDSSRNDSKNKRLTEKKKSTHHAENNSTTHGDVTDTRGQRDLNYAQPKRGQRHKLKKLKNKYKDQDEEERTMKMELLQQSQSQKARDRKAKRTKAATKQFSQNKLKIQPKKQKPPTKSEQNDATYDSEEERAKVLENEHLNKESSGILSSLTGCPFADDILLFALPVCAPYNTMHNYKFKVKLTPGNTKKGKAAKSALSLFQNMKETTGPEKDQLRSIKDHDLARNIPGKVKVSSTSQQLHKKKKGK